MDEYLNVKLYPCCDDPKCPYCYGSGVVSGEEIDLFLTKLEEYLSERDAILNEECDK